MRKISKIFLTTLLLTFLALKANSQEPNSFKFIKALKQKNYQLIIQQADNNYAKILAAIEAEKFNLAISIAQNLSQQQYYLWLTRIYLKQKDIDKAKLTFSYLLAIIPTYCKLKYLFEQDTLLISLISTQYWNSVWDSIYQNEPVAKLYNRNLALFLMNNPIQTPENPNNLILNFLETVKANKLTQLPKCPGLEAVILKLAQNIVNLENKNFFWINQKLLSKYLDTKAVLNLANYYYHTNQFQLAQSYLKYYVQIFENDKIELSKAMNLAFFYQDYQTALSIANKILTFDKADYQVWKIQGLSYIHLNMPKKAYHSLTMSLDLYPHQPELFMLIGDLAWELKDKHTACLYWKNAYDIFHDPEALFKYRNKCK